MGHSDDLHGGGLSGAARVFSNDLGTKIILAEMGNISVTMACECISEIRQNGGNVIVLGGQTDISAYRALIKAGALEYFTFPVTAEEILNVEVSAPKAEAKTDQPTEVLSRSMSIAVLGSNGGVGVSLLAQNLAFHASSPKGGSRRTALIDADLSFGSQAIDLDREETVGLFEALQSPDRIDGTFIAATMDHVRHGLSMYSRQVGIGQDVQTYEAGLPHLYAPLRAEFDIITTDLPRACVLRNIELVKQFDALILVIPTGFSGVNAARRLIDGIAAYAPDLRIIPVLSDLRTDAGISAKDVAATIGRPIAAVLPRSDAALMRAHRAARPLVEMQPKGAYAKAVRTLWASAMAAPAKPANAGRRSLLRRIFS